MACFFPSQRSLAALRDRSSIASSLGNRQTAMAEPDDEWLLLQEELEEDEEGSLAPIDPATSVGLLTDADAALNEGLEAPPPSATRLAGVSKAC